MISLQDQKEKELKKKKGSAKAETDSSMASNNSKRGVFQNAMFLDFIMKEVIKEE